MPAPALLRVAATLASVALMVSPFPDFHRVHANKATGEVALLPVVALFANCFMWVTYALLTGAYFPLLGVNLLGVATCTGFVAIFYRWSTTRAEVVRVCASAALALTAAALYAAAGARGLTGQTLGEVVATLGPVCVVVNVMLFISPLKTTGKVLRTKSSASLPFSLCAATFGCSFLWAVLSFLDDDLFVMAPNALGTVLSGFQVALCVAYPSTTAFTEVPAPVVVVVAADKLAEVNAGRTSAKAPLYGGRSTYSTFEARTLAEEAVREPISVAA
jgi:solute carrier family 50 protein (sugar transporter)